jgi:hypothetical protein
MKPLVSIAIVSALLHSSLALAAAPQYEFRVATKGVKNSNAANPGNTPGAGPSGGVPAVVWTFRARGCYFNGGVSYTPLWEAGDDATLCQAFIGRYIYNDVFSTSSDPFVFLNTPTSALTSNPITSSYAENGRCTVRHAGGGNSIRAFVSDADMQMCLSNGAVGKYLGNFSHENSRATPMTDMVHPVAGVQQQITSSVPGSACMVAYNDENKYQFVPNYMENGVNLCEGDVVYYRASDQTLHSKP